MVGERVKAITNRAGDRLTLLGWCWIHLAVGLWWIWRHRCLHVSWSIGPCWVHWVWSQCLIIWWRRRVSHKCSCLQWGCAGHRLDCCFKFRTNKSFLVNIRTVVIVMSRHSRALQNSLRISASFTFLRIHEIYKTKLQIAIKLWEL